MSNAFKTEVIKTHPRLPARVTKVTTPHGVFLSPAFMPVATRAYMNFMAPSDLKKTQSQIILGGNTYHMLCAPGMAAIEQVGGMHRFMGWDGPMLTDSGGFQVFSLSKKGNLCKIKPDGAYFKHPLTGQTIPLTPKASIEAQRTIGADIIMAFDECTPENGDRIAALHAMERTHRWLDESIEAFHNAPAKYGATQALFGIIQGGGFPDLRAQSAEYIVKANLDGIAIGGEVIGSDMAKTMSVLDWVCPALPAHKIRYTMGVGAKPQDLIDVVSKGADIFDCVAPTRNARHGTLYYGEWAAKDDWLYFEAHGTEGKILIKKSEFAKDERPIHPRCTCTTCQNYSRAYLHYLFKQKAVAYSHLASIHNVHVMQSVCIAMRELILSA